MSKRDWWDKMEVDPHMVRWIVQIALFGERSRVEAMKNMPGPGGRPLGDLVKVTTEWDGWNMKECQHTTWTKILDARDNIVKAVKAANSEHLDRLPPWLVEEATASAAPPSETSAPSSPASTPSG